MARTGGMMRRARERSPLRLSLADREELSRGLIAGDSLRRIAARLGRAVSTISREVAWNGPRDCLSRLAGREDGRQARAKAQASEAGDPSAAVP